MTSPTRMKKALIIGIRYRSASDRGLTSTCRNVEAMKELLIKNFGYREDDIHVLLDDGKHNLPTRENILAEIMNLVEGAQPADSMFFHFSGHVAQESGEDADTILPSDYPTAGGISTRDIQYQYGRLPRGCNLTAIFDCCQSAIPLDLLQVNVVRAKAARITGENVLSEPHCQNEKGHDPLTNTPLSSPDLALILPDIKRANRHPSNDLKLDMALKFPWKDDYLAVAEAELHRERSKWLQISRQLKTAVFAGGAGGLFLGSPWMETSCDEETALLHALEAWNYTVSLFPAFAILSQTCVIFEIALEAARDRNRRAQQIFHLARGVASLVQLVVLDRPSVIAANEKAGMRSSLSPGHNEAGFHTLLSVQTLLRDVRDFLERIVKRGFLGSVLFAGDNQVAYGGLCQRLHSMYEKICETRRSEKQPVRGAEVVKRDLSALLKRLKQSSHIVACTSVALSFISQCKKSGFDYLSSKLLEATMKDAMAFPSLSSLSYITSVEEISLHHNRTLFDEPSLTTLINTFDESSRRVMDAAADEARQKALFDGGQELWDASSFAFCNLESLASSP